MAARKGKRRGVSRQEWLEAGLQTLADGGIESVTVESLARSLGIAKSGFYWHFKDRADLLERLLEYWSHEMTEILSENPEIAGLAPIDRLIQIAETIVEYDLTRYEMPIRLWALRDPDAARGVRRVNKKRMAFVGEAFAELGFEGDDLEMRTMLFVCYHTWEAPMFREVSRKRRRELIASRVELLTRSG